MSNNQQQVSPDAEHIDGAVYDDPKITYLKQRKNGEESLGMSSPPEKDKTLQKDKSLNKDEPLKPDFQDKTDPTKTDLNTVHAEIKQREITQESPLRQNTFSPTEPLDHAERLRFGADINQLKAEVAYFKNKSHDFKSQSENQVTNQIAERHHIPDHNLHLKTAQKSQGDTHHLFVPVGYDSPPNQGVSATHKAQADDINTSKAEREHPYLHEPPNSSAYKQEGLAMTERPHDETSLSASLAKTQKQEEMTGQVQKKAHPSASEFLDFSDIENLVVAHIQQKILAQNLEVQIKHEAGMFPQIPDNPSIQNSNMGYPAGREPVQTYTQNVHEGSQPHNKQYLRQDSNHEYKDYLLQIEELETASIEKILKEDITAYSQAAQQAQQAAKTALSTGFIPHNTTHNIQQNGILTEHPQKQMMQNEMANAGNSLLSSGPNNIEKSQQQQPQHAKTTHIQGFQPPLSQMPPSEIHHGHFASGQTSNADRVSHLQSLDAQSATQKQHMPRNVAFGMLEQENIKHLERWLEKPKNAKTGRSMTVLVIVCLVITAASLGGTGYFAYNTYYDTSHKGEALLNGFTDTSVSVQSAQTESNQTRSFFGDATRSSHSEQGRGQGSGPGGSGNGGEPPQNNISDYNKRAVMIPPVIDKASGHPCDVPDIKLVPLDGGRTKIFVVSDCHKNQKIEIKYGGITFKRSLNHEGQFEFLLDCFAGDQTPIEIYFEDGSQYVKAPITKDLDRVIKFAVIWSGPINFDLHAFEYGAESGADGHIWEKQPQSYKIAYDLMRKTGLGRGFLSTVSSGDADGKTLEVYTFLNYPVQKKDSISLSLSYVKNPPGLPNTNCAAASDDRVAYETVKLVNNRNEERYEGIVAVKNCVTSYLNKASLRQNSESIQLSVGE